MKESIDGVAVTSVSESDLSDALSDPDLVLAAADRTCFESVPEMQTTLTDGD